MTIICTAYAPNLNTFLLQGLRSDLDSVLPGASCRVYGHDDVYTIRVVFSDEMVELITLLTLRNFIKTQIHCAALSLTIFP